MFAPTARRTPTQLPTWWWTLALAMMLLSVLAPAVAADAKPAAPPALDPRATNEALHNGRWQLVGMDRMIRATQRLDAAATPRMLPLAVLPSQRSAWWLGLSASRVTGARLELRWTMPLDGGAAASRALDD